MEIENSRESLGEAERLAEPERCQECVDCGEHNPTEHCHGCREPLCYSCYRATDGYCDGCLSEEYCPGCGQDWGYCECEEE